MKIDAVDFFSAASAAPMDMGAALDDLFDLYVIEYFGTSGADTFVGAGNIDLLAGGAGNDMLRGDGGNDILVGGPGNDTYFWSPGDGYDVVYSTGDTGGMDVIRIEGSGYFDLNWSFNNDGHFYVGVAVDSNYFWPDTGGNIRMQNFLTEGSSVQYFEADTNANGFYSADGSISRVYLTSGGIGTNQGGGFNNLSGTDQGIYTEVVTGTKLPDFLTTGGGFRDYLYGRAGDDTLVGSDSTRTDMRGGGGNDTLLGANNVDRIVGNHGFDLMDGGGGNDMARYDRDGGGNGVFVNLSAGPVTEQFQGQDTTVGPGSAIDSWGFIDTLVSIEDVRGTDTDDVIVGSSVSNNLSGRGGNDRIIGLDGDDILRGGGGADDFVFLANDTGMDTILDFGLIDDRLDLTDLLGPSFDPMNEAGYISAVADGTGNTIVSVDQTGTGEFFDPVATLNGVSSGATLTYIFNGNQTDTIDVP